MREERVSAVAVSLAAILLLALGFAGVAHGAEVPPFCLPGSGLGQCKGPGGVAVDEEFEAGVARVYVADSGNNRVNVFGTKGEPITSFAAGSKPAWVAVDNGAASASRHDVYVSNETAPLVRKFKPSGSSYEELGGESFGVEGTGPCQFAANDPIAVGPGGNVYVADSVQVSSGPPVYKNRVLVFSPAGSCLEEMQLFEAANQSIRNFAVDSGGHMYVTIAGGGGAIRKYSPSGTKELEIATGPEDRGTEAEGLAVDAAGHLFAKQRGEESPSFFFFTEFSSTGTKLRRFGYVRPEASFIVPALAAFHSPDGDLYASEGSLGVEYLQEGSGPEVAPVPCEAPPLTLGNTKATLKALINPEGEETSFKFEYEAVAGGPVLSTTPHTISAATLPFDLHEATFKVEGLEPETEYRCRVVAENAGGTASGQQGSFITREGFEFGPSWSGEVGETEATIFAEGNPLEIPATGQIEYVEDAKYQASGFAEAQSAPSPELDFGAGATMKLVEARLTGLKPGTLYHYRLRARNGTPPQGIICPEQRTVCPELEHTFRTYLPEASEADSRRYELVSPGQKNTAEVAVPENAAGIADPRMVKIEAVAGSGEAATYTSWTSFGPAGGAPATSQYLSRRTPSGWSTENISPFGFIAVPLIPPFSGFTPELDLGVFKTTEPPLTGDCRQPSPGTIAENIYLRDNQSGRLRCLDPEVIGGPEGKPCLVYAGVSEDGSRAFIAGRPEGGESFSYRLYESTQGGIAAVSVLPGGALAPPTRGTQFGPPGNSFSGEENCQVTRTRLRNAISADGSKAFWTFVPELRLAQTAPGVQVLAVVTGGEPYRLQFQGQITAPIASNANAAAIQAALEALSTIGAGNVEVSGSSPFTITFKGTLTGATQKVEAIRESSRLYVRVNGTETLQLDKHQSGAGTAAGNGVFWAASADGSLAYFTDAEKLVSGANPAEEEPDLYRYQVGAASPLTDLTKGSVPGNVQGVIGASNDGSYLYFVAKAALSGGQEENAAGEKAKAGKDNLYLSHEGTLTFIATLSEEDSNDWAANPRILSARVSPDGRHLAFLSVEAQRLAGYDNEVAEGKHCQYELSKPGTTSFVGSPLCTQAFVYDAAESGPGTLTCASCNPAGTRPLGPALLPGWSNGFEGPRYLSDNGRRYFFQSWDALLPADVNGKSDVYEFERPGEGTCNAANPNFDPKAGGCHFLITSGRSGDESFLIGASANGRDAFFSTRQALVGWDVNENYDVYDFREGGGFAEPLPNIVCEGEGECKPPATAPPPAPATPSFNGPGNPQPKKPKPHKKKHHKAKKKGKGKKHKKGKGKKGRAGR